MGHSRQADGWRTSAGQQWHSPIPCAVRKQPLCPQALFSVVPRQDHPETPENDGCATVYYGGCAPVKWRAAFPEGARPRVTWLLVAKRANPKQILDCWQRVGHMGPCDGTRLRNRRRPCARSLHVNIAIAAVFLWLLEGGSLSKGLAVSSGFCVTRTAALVALQEITLA